MTTIEPRRVRDPRALTALAHPVRVGILEILTLEGALTATELGDRLAESPANCSWHLRKLAEHGFVDELPGEGRRRPWQVSQYGLTWSGEDSSPAEQRAGHELGAMLMQRWLERYLAADLHETDPVWREARSMHQSAAYLTADELQQLNDDLAAVMRRHEERITDPSTRPEGSRLCEIVSWAGPVVLGGAR